MILARNLGRGRFGRAARAMQADEEAAQGLGVPALRYKTAVYVLAAAMAALAGSLYVHYGRYISPEDFGIRQSVLLFTAMLLGGYRSVFGGLAALVFLVSLPELGRDFAETQLLTALALMIVYAISSEGLAGIGKAVVGKLGIGRAHAGDR
jgi:branched-chain amino acid transport system permease protein